MSRVRRRSVIAVAAIALFGPLLVSTPALAQEPFACPENRICVYDQADGSDEGFVLEARWEGGQLLAPDGWNDRVSAVRNNRIYPARLLDNRADGSADGCNTIIAVFDPGTQGAVPADADNRADIVYWSELDGTTSGYLCAPYDYECPEGQLCLFEGKGGPTRLGALHIPDGPARRIDLWTSHNSGWWADRTTSLINRTSHTVSFVHRPESNPNVHAVLHTAPPGSRTLLTGDKDDAIDLVVFQ